MSTYAIYGEIVFGYARSRGEIKLRRFNSISIESSFKSLGDTAEITLPRYVRDYDRNKITEVFKEGDPVSISYGYDGKLAEEFSGYISKIGLGIPIVIKCDDEMYKLRRTRVSISKSDCTLKQLLQSVATGYEIECDNTALIGSVRYSNEYASVILDELKNKNINVWFEGKVLRAFSVSKSDVEPVNITLEKTAGESLSQKAIEEVYVIVKCLTRIKKRAQRYLTATWGEANAPCKIEKKINGINLTETDLRNEAKAIYNLKKQPGLEGDLTLFGIPVIRHGMRIKLDSVLYPEKNGIYYVDAVKKILSRDGIRQTCKLGDKAV